MKFRNCFVAVLASISLTGCGLAGMIDRDTAYNYGVLSHASQHINATKEFNENNLGLGVGSEAELRGTRWSFGVEGGVFENSNNNTTPYGVAYFERDMLLDRPRALRAGFFSGYARYPDEADKSGRIFPAIGDYIPVVGLQMTIPTVWRHEFRLRMAPGLNRSKAIIALQSNFVF